MALAIIPPPPAAIYADGDLTSPLDRTFRVQQGAHLGFGIIRPFRRDEKRDFAHAGGVALVKACVGQVLMTRGSSVDNPLLQGELDWNPEFGSLLYRLRHRTNTYVNHALARVYVTDALRRWEPRVIVKSVTAGPDAQNKNVMLVRLLYDVIATNVPGNRVIYPNIDQTVPIRIAA